MITVIIAPVVFKVSYNVKNL